MIRLSDTMISGLIGVTAPMTYINKKYPLPAPNTYNALKKHRLIQPGYNHLTGYVLTEKGQAALILADKLDYKEKEFGV